MQWYKCLLLFWVHTAPVWIFDDAPVDPLLQDFKVRDAGCFSEVETQLLGLAVTGVVEGSIVKKTQRRPAHTLPFVHRGRCKNNGSSRFTSEQYQLSKDYLQRLFSDSGWKYFYYFEVPFYATLHFILHYISEWNVVLHHIYLTALVTSQMRILHLKDTSL